MKNRKNWVVVGLILVTWLYVVSNKDEGPVTSHKSVEQAEPIATQPEQVEPAAEPKKAQRVSDVCEGVEQASQQQMDMIAWVQHAGNSVKPRGWAYRSTEHKKAYYVAAYVIGPGIEGGILSTWIFSGDKDSPGLINSVDEGGKQFSREILYGGDTTFGTSPFDPGARKVKQCAQQG